MPILPLITAGLSAARLLGGGTSQGSMLSGIGKLMGGGDSPTAGGTDSPKTGLANMFNADTGGIASLGIGALKNLQANRQQKEANAMFPGGEDPELRMLAGDFRRRKRAFQTGTAMTAELANQRALAKQGINAAFRAGGGAAGLNRMGQLTGQAMLGNKQAGMQGEMFYADKYGETINRLAQTRLEKALLRYNQGQAEAKQTKTDANRFMYGGLARTLGTGNPYDASTGTVPKTTSQQLYDADGNKVDQYGNLI
jgi:hypothetical protein